MPSALEFSTKAWSSGHDIISLPRRHGYRAFRVSTGARVRCRPTVPNNSGCISCCMLSAAAACRQIVCSPIARELYSKCTITALYRASTSDSTNAHSTSVLLLISSLLNLRSLTMHVRLSGLTFDLTMLTRFAVSNDLMYDLITCGCA